MYVFPPSTVQQVKFLNTVSSMKEGSLSLVDCYLPIIQRNQLAMTGAKFCHRDELKCAGELKEIVKIKNPVGVVLYLLPFGHRCCKSTWLVLLMLTDAPNMAEKLGFELECSSTMSLHQNRLEDRLTCELPDPSPSTSHSVTWGRA